MSDTELDRSVLDTKDREELHQIAGAMGVNAATRMKKADLIDAILGAADGGGASDGAANSDGGGRPKRVRSRRAHDADDPLAELAAEEDAIAAAGGSDDESDQPRPVSRTTSSSTGDGDGEPSSSDGASDTSQSTATSTNDTKSKSTAHDGNGGGRTGTKPRIEPEDERQSYGEGNRRRRRRRGRDRQQDSEPREFQGEPVATEGLLDLRDEGYGFLRATSYLPGPEDVYVSASQVRRFALRKGDFLKGFARPQASNEKYPALLRVDQVNDLPTEAARERPKFEDLTPLFPDSRLALELGDDPASITGRIVDLVSPIGKGQRGLVVSPPKAGKTTILKQIVYSAARNIEEGGSLTIVATALIETGSRMDEVIFEEFKGTGNMELRLDRRLSERRIYPSIDVEASSTRYEELLFDRNQLQQVWKLRRVLNALEEGKGLELLIDKIRTTKSNDEFLAEIAKTPGG